MTKSSKAILTVAVIAIALIAVVLKYRHYVVNPWTRDGQVRANVIQVTPRVSGPLVELPIKDNQFVKKGDLLFRIDPRTYQASLDQAQAQYDQTVEQLDSLDRQVEAAQAQVDQAEAQIAQAESQVRSAEAAAVQSMRQLERYDVLLKDGNVSRSVYDQQRKSYDVDKANKDRADAALNQAHSAMNQAEAQKATAVAKRGSKGDSNSQLRNARAALKQARLNLEFTEQRAPVDGYITNLSLRLGSQANAGAPAMALVDVKSFWVDAYFRETLIGSFKPGDAAFITLMSHPNTVIRGEVDSIAWGIAKQDGSTSQSLLPAVQPSFEWIRLAQRIPVKIVLVAVPENVALRVGSTASVMVRTGSAGRQPPVDPPPPVPKALQ